MDPRTQVPPADVSTETSQSPNDADARRQRHQHLDEELDKELDGTFPASDPIPWSHEVK